MATGSIAGAVVGGALLRSVPSAVIVPVLVALLLVTSVKVWLASIERADASVSA
ncbi:MAG TPA: hypothetical protein VLK34_02590 [Nocardioidaceae bacterium]|nr:hypothetical protein [Nocardioidaceae bacterium]